MDLTGDSRKQALDKLPNQTAAERDPGKFRRPVRQITHPQAERTSFLKLGPAPKKVWWPSSCRGIVG